MERTKRIDAEFFQRENLDVLTKVSKFECKTIADVSFVSDGNHFAISDDFEEFGIPYYRGQDLTGNFFVEQSTPNFINEKAFWQGFMLRSHLKKGDVLLSIVGTVGSVAVVDKTFDATCSCKIAILRPKDGIKTEYLATFLYSKYGNNQIKKFVRGAVQTGFILEDTSQVKVPLLSLSFQSKIADLIQKAHAKLEESKALYAEAENLLLDELGLRDWSPSDDSISVKSFAESFADTGRLDAEYYQPKYDELLKLIKNNSVGAVKTIAQISEPLRYGSSAKLNYIESGVPFLRIADITNHRFDAEKIKYISGEAASDEIFASVETNDVLVSRSGTLGLSVSIPKHLNGSIFGSYFIRVRPDNDLIDSDFLALYLNSKVGALQVEQISTGGIQTNLTVPVIEALKIVVPSKERQKHFADAVKKSFSAQDQSKQLLEIAKRAVELAIETSEEAAMSWIDAKLKILS